MTFPNDISFGELPVICLILPFCDLDYLRLGKLSIYPLGNKHRPWQIGFGRLVSINNWLFSGSMFIYQRVIVCNPPRRNMPRVMRANFFHRRFQVEKRGRRRRRVRRLDGRRFEGIPRESSGALQGISFVMMSNDS